VTTSCTVRKGKLVRSPSGACTTVTRGFAGAQIAGQQATLGIEDFIALLALLSINLGFINLLPVPMLDGGHLFFYAIEAVRPRPVSAQALDWAFRGGLALILALLVFATFNDLGLWNQLERLIG